MQDKTVLIKQVVQKKNDTFLHEYFQKNTSDQRC